VLRRKLGQDRETLRLPGGPLIPIAACIVCLAFVASATLTNLVAGALALLAGLPIYFWRRPMLSRPPKEGQSR
jgi:Flp pilus assembly protein TadB